jgi:polyhydroxybutyrate depolymerase
MKRTAISLVILGLAGLVLAASAQEGNPLGERLQRFDTNGDGKLSMDEVAVYPPLEERLRGADRDGDGLLTIEEIQEQLAGGPAPPEPELSTGPLGPGEAVRVITVGELERRYRVYVPASYSPNRPTPVVLAFHGGGGSPASMVRFSGLSEKADEAGFIVVYPYGIGREQTRFLTFNGGNCCGLAMQNKVDDVAYVRALLDDLATAANVDADRVFATGMSNGAIVSYYLASKLADRIAAIAPVGAPMGTETCDPSRPVSVMHFHGTADRAAPYEGGRAQRPDGRPGPTDFYSVDHTISTWVEANGCDPEPEVVELPDTADDGMRVVRSNYGPCREGTEVVLVAIEGGGHTWPGQVPVVSYLGKSTQDISANDMMWEFFQKHPRTPSAAAGPAGTDATASPSRVVQGEFASDLIPEPMKYAVLLPPGYDESDERYAILYDVYPAGRMGHRMIRKPQGIMPELWQEGRMPKVLVVVPAIDISLYMDPNGTGRKWEELLVGPFVDHLRKEFRVVEDRQCLYATGLSAGGAISLRLGLKHPDVFGGIAVLAPGIEAAASLDDLDFEDTFWRPQNIYDNVDPDVWAAGHPLNIAKANADAIRAHQLGIYLESGDEDSFMLHRGTDAMHRVLWDLGIPHEYHLRRGVDHHVGQLMRTRWEDAYVFLGSQIEPRSLEPIEVKLKELIAQMREQAAKGIPNDPELVRIRMQLVRLRGTMQEEE